MKYNNLGRSGLKVSELSLGSWLTFGNQLDATGVRLSMRRAFEAGINFFDNAEVYAQGKSEQMMGEILKDFRREDVVVSTKIFWGGQGPNDTGLSWKHLVEGTKASLKRLQLEYVDLLFCHRADPTTPIEETVRAMDYLIKSGRAFYWGTSEWPADKIQQAYEIAERLNCIPPTMEQPHYNMMGRALVEQEYAPLFKKYGMGTTTWSPLASGILTGKYNKGLPAGSRLDQNEWLRERLTPQKIEMVKELEGFAHELDCTLAQLGIAWCLKNPNVSTVILGASNVQQLEENLKAAAVKERLTDEMMKRIATVLDRYEDTPR